MDSHRDELELLRLKVHGDITWPILFYGFQVTISIFDKSTLLSIETRYRSTSKRSIRTSLLMGSFNDSP